LKPSDPGRNQADPKEDNDSARDIKNGLQHIQQFDEKTTSDQVQIISFLPRILFAALSLPIVFFSYRVWLEAQNQDPILASPKVAVQAPMAGAIPPQVPATVPETMASYPKNTTKRPYGANGGSMLSMACLTGGESEQAAPADPSNYGPRLSADWQGRPVNKKPALIVLHETVVDEAAALALFRSPHSSDGQQASYHVLIGRDGRRIRVVPDEERAFGAGDSDFQGLGLQLKQGLRPSVNNIALHVSLVSPPDGSDGERRDHSGYTQAQYQSLASQIALWQALYGIQPQAVVTHQEVDRSGTRRDPRSFDWGSLSQDLRSRWLACGGSAQIANPGRGMYPPPQP